jgi:hypothetical protein
MRILTLSHVVGNWILVDGTCTSYTPDSIAGAFAVFPINSYGNPLITTTLFLQNFISLQSHSNSPHSSPTREAVPSLLVTVSPGKIACYFGIDGPRVFLSEGRRFEKAEIVRIYGGAVLVIVSSDREISYFSLPDLIPIDKVRIEASLQ